MSNGIGRISGPLLKDNLVRDGTDLAFETDLLYLEVNDEKIGIKTDSPSRDLNIEDSAKTIDLIVDNYIDAANVNFDTTSTISTDLDKLFLDSNEFINVPSLRADNIRFNNNSFYSLVQDSDLEIRPTNKTVFGSNTHVTGNIHATENITLGGNIIFGSDNTDSVVLEADVDSNIIPDVNSTYNLGTPNKRWKDLYVKAVDTNLIFADNLVVAADIDYNLRFTNAYFVSTTGSNSNRGNHQNAPYRNINYALTRATAGDTIFVYPGTYTEIFPLTVPAGVSVVGFDIRTTIIKPTELTNNKDAFLLNGETTVTDITVKDFYYDITNDTGYAFRFADNFTVTSRSPYVQNVSVITNSTTGGATPADIYVDPLGLAGSYSSNSVAVDQVNYTQSQVESWIGKKLVTWNGELFPVTFYEIVDVIDEPLDPGFVWRIVLERDLEDPVEGTYQFSIYPNDGETSIVGTSGYTAATDYSRSFLKTSLPLLFDTTVTEFWTCQIGEGLNIVDSVEEDPTNSTWWRVNFKDVATLTFGLPIFTSPSGSSIIPAGRGALVDGSVATIDSKEASMLFHSVTFITPGTDALIMTNGVRVEWLNSFTYFANRGLYAVDGSLGFAGLGVRFGAEIRSIGSANVYGTYGAVADGASTLMYLINHNFGYVGSGLDSSNDNTLVVQENEIVELNAGKIYYTSQAQNGNFRVGDEFVVDFNQGRVNFDTTGLALDGVSTIFFQGSIDRTFLEAGRIETGDFLLENNKIKTLTSDFNLLSASNEIIFLQNVNIDKNIFIRDNVTVSGNVFLGNEPFDKITINTNFSQNLYPKIDNEYTLGTNSRRWRDFYVDTVNLQDIRIEDNQIFTTVEDSDLIFVGNTNGGIKLQDLLFKNSTISSYNNRNIILTPNTDKSLVIFGTSAFRIPRTVTTLNLTGDLRFNTSSNQYEGYSSALVTLGGIYSSDKRTSVLAHPTNNTFIFTTNNIVNTTLTNSTLNTVRFETGTLVFDNNTISSTTGNISLVGDKTTLGQIIFEDHTISVLENQNINLATTNQGYVQFAGEKAIVIPSGTSSERPADPILGSTRYNSELNFMETWNGSNWQSVAGEGDLADFEYANESTTIWSLVVG